MRVAVTYTRTLCGIKAELVNIETHLANGLPGLFIVGMPDTVVKESKERVKSAIQNCGFEFPSRRIVINLAPAHLPKDDSGFDLPIALSILAASQQIDSEVLLQYEFSSELALSGSLRGVECILPIAVAAHEAKRCLVVAPNNQEEACMPGGNAVLVAHDLKEIYAHLKNEKPLGSATPIRSTALQRDPLNLCEVQGQAAAKRALEIAAAGGHHLLMRGPPGTGKSMLARRLPSILPPLDASMALEVQTIYSVHSGQIPPPWGCRPFRAPHHTTPPIALAGGGAKPRPGEISLAHHGVLFLDEIAEYNRKTLEILREPLEQQCIMISRSLESICLPAAFQLVAAMNPCPCGYHGHPHQNCDCRSDQIKRYRQQISGPLFDRIDLHTEVPYLEPNFLSLYPKDAEKSEAVQQRVREARERQKQRNGKLNVQLSNTELNACCQLNDSVQSILQKAIEKFQLSARSFYRLLKVARTIADLGGHDDIEADDLHEALVYRQMR